MMTSTRRAALVARVDEAAAHADYLDRLSMRRRVRTARRLSAAHVLTSVIAALTCLVAVTVAAVAVTYSGESPTEPDAVRTAATAAVRSLLTADPARPDDYVSVAESVSSGEFRARIDADRSDITAAVAQLGGPSSGVVIAAGVVGGDATDRADLLIVAQANAPQLLGASGTDSRITLDVAMAKSDGRWTVSRAVVR